MTHYRCDGCLAHFQTNDPSHAACPACGEWVEERECEYTDRDGSFVIGGNVSKIPRAESRVA